MTLVALRWIVLAALFGTIAKPCLAAKRVTVEQLEQTLMSDRASHKSDAEILKQIGALALSEQLTDSTLSRLIADLGIDSQARVSLQLLADWSAFLDPPTSEIPVSAVPDDAAQQKMLEAARAYGMQTLPRLPNFVATRTTIRYEDTPQALKEGDWPVRAGLHRVDASTREITVWGEREHQVGSGVSGLGQQQTGLTSGGEFGSTLAMILADTGQGRVMWGRWERGSAGLIAVLRYSVPKSASHYEVIGSLQRQAAIEGIATHGNGARGTAGLSTQPSGAGSSSASVEHRRAGYHGSLWIDPATGTILRITLEADAKDSAPFRRAAILVEYGPVQIGGSSFVCPVRSVALSEAIPDAQLIVGDQPTEWLNETLFTAYHRFASTVRILSNGDPP